MTVKITGFADEIAPELTAQIAGLNVLCGDAWSGWRKSDLSHG